MIAGVCDKATEDTSRKFNFQKFYLRKLRLTAEKVSSRMKNIRTGFVSEHKV